MYLPDINVWLALAYRLPGQLPGIIIFRPLLLPATVTLPRRATELAW